MDFDLATIDHLLTTTRSVRKRLDLSRPVERGAIERCSDLDTQAPTGSNLQGWHFMVVTDVAKRAALAQLYRQAHEAYYQIQLQHPHQFAEGDLRARQRPRVSESSIYLRENLHQVPVHIIPCIETSMQEAPALAEMMANRSSSLMAAMYGSVIPAAWSLMLALRVRGIGSSWTTLHLMYESEAARLLGIPDHVSQVALLPVAHFTGDDFKPAKRRPPTEVTHWDSWD